MIEPHYCAGCLICKPQTLGGPIYVPVYVPYPVAVPWPLPVPQPAIVPWMPAQPHIVWCGPHTTGTATTGFQST